MTQETRGTVKSLFDFSDSLAVRSENGKIDFGVFQVAGYVTARNGDKRIPDSRVLDFSYGIGDHPCDLVVDSHPSVIRHVFYDAAHPSGRPGLPFFSAALRKSLFVSVLFSF